MKRRLKKSVVYVLYGFAFVIMLGGLFFIDSSSEKVNLDSSEDYKYVSKDIIDTVKDIPVNVIEDTKVLINKPYNDESVKIVKNYYSVTDDEDTQKNSIIFYENTYLPSSGVSYGNDADFDILAILDGKVLEVREDEILGNVITIEHSNGIVSSYQSVADIRVKADDMVKQGDAINEQVLTAYLFHIQKILYNSVKHTLDLFSHFLSKS